MTNKIIYGSFITQNTSYEQVFEQFLESSFKKLKLPNILRIIPNLNMWQKNVACKPQVIHDLLQEEFVRQFDYLVFLDSDAEILEYPKLFDDINCDIAFHRLDWSTWYNRSNDTTKEVLSGTLVLKTNSKKVLDFVKKWSIEAKESLQWEQKILEKLLPDSGLNIVELPLSYCYIKTLPNGNEPHVKIKNPVIVHNQVSRQFKGKIL